MNVYNAGTRIANIYVYQTANGYVMIDAGYDNSLAKIEKKLIRIGLDFSKIKYVFLTHAHDDHAGSLKAMLDEYPHLKVVVNEKSIPVLANGQNPFIGGCSSWLALMFCNVMKMFGRGKHLFPAIDSNYLNRMLIVSDDNKSEIESILEGKILFTPGHTSDSMSLVIGDCIFCGDAAMNGFPSLNRITIWVENKKDFEDSWELMINENPKYVYPGHGEAFPTSVLEQKKCNIVKMKMYELK